MNNKIIAQIKTGKFLKAEIALIIGKLRTKYIESVATEAELFISKCNPELQVFVAKGFLIDGLENEESIISALIKNCNPSKKSEIAALIISKCNSENEVKFVAKIMQEIDDKSQAQVAVAIIRNCSIDNLLLAVVEIMKAIHNSNSDNLEAVANVLRTEINISNSGFDQYLDEIFQLFFNPDIAREDALNEFLAMDEDKKSAYIISALEDDEFAAEMLLDKRDVKKIAHTVKAMEDNEKAASILFAMEDERKFADILIAMDNNKKAANILEALVVITDCEKAASIMLAINDNKKAASIFEKMDPQYAINILKVIDEDRAALILLAMEDEQKAARFSKLL